MIQIVQEEADAKTPFAETIVEQSNANSDKSVSKANVLWLIVLQINNAQIRKYVTKVNALINA